MLSSAIIARSGLSSDSLRISHRSRQLSTSSNSPLQELGVYNNATIDVSSRLRGGAPKKRCAFVFAKQQASSSASTTVVATSSDASTSATAPTPQQLEGSTSTSAESCGNASSTAAESSASTASSATVLPSPATLEAILERCSSAALRMVGDCPRCTKSYCSTHRLPEDHACPALAGWRKQAFDENRAKLEKEAVITSKISAF
ncbi:hypothetical protein EMMF5_005634 [Cystobasidiomycetes sp. EMM_F5]